MKTFSKLRIISFPLTLIVIPIIIQFIFINHFAVNVPFWDQWQFIPTIQKFQEGGNWIQFIWRPDDVHRQFFPKLIFLLLSGFTNWNTIIEMYFSFLLSCMNLIIIWLIYRKTTHGNIWGFVPLAWLFTSLGQWENMLWGWQISIYLMVFCSLLTFYLLSIQDKLAFIGAIVSGVIASYSFNTGLYVWPIGLMFLLLKKSSWKSIAIWLLASTATITFYFTHFDTSRVRSPYEILLTQPELFGHFFVVNIGAPLGGLSLWLSTFLGTALLILGSYFVIQKLRNFIDTRTLPSKEILPISLFAYSMLASLFITLGRVGFGQIKWAASSRYTTITVIGVTSVYIFLLQNLEAHNFGKRQKHLLISFLGSMLIGLLYVNIRGFQLGQHRYTVLKKGQFIAQTMDYQPNAELEKIYFSAEQLRNQWAPYAQKTGITSFGFVPDTLINTSRDNGQLLNELLPTQPVIQQFECSVPTLHDIGISFTNYNRQNTSEFKIMLLDNQGVLLWQQQYPTSAILNDGFQYFTLPNPIKSCHGQLLELKIISINGMSGNSIAAWVYPRYYQGNLATVPLSNTKDSVLGLELNTLYYGINQQ